MQEKKYGINKRLVSFFLIFMFLLLPIGNAAVTEAAQKTLSIGVVKNLALANSSECSSLQSKISLKEVSYKQAVKSLQLKRKNKTTFRWSPTLSFSFPQPLNLAEESEFVYKPMQIESEITELKHKLADAKFSVYEEVSNLFVSVFSKQEIIAFQEEQMKNLETTLTKNKARLLLGLANEKDVTQIEDKISSLQDSLSANKREFESDKKKLGDLINLDVTTQYRFLKPYVETELPREQLENLVEYTLANDQSYYEAKMNTQLALLQLNTNYDLMRNQYSPNMYHINSYVEQVKRGEKVDSNAFKLSYDKFLAAIDAPWQGNIKIFFVKIPKEWFKGEVDGVRYTEDEPYTLYENALGYQDALIEQKQLAKDLESQVRDSFESQVSARLSYESLKEQIEKDKKNLNNLSIMNSLGTCTFEEYTEAQDQYEELLMDSLDALGLYSTLLYSYDRLTCGAISIYLSEKDIALDAASGAESYIVEEAEGYEGAYYYIKRLVEDNVFELGIYIPDELETDITHFELWCDGIQIGARTELTKVIRHLALSKSEIDKAVIRLYEDDSYVSECDIDPQSYQGPLEIPGEYVVVKADDKTQIGTFVVSQNSQTSLVEVTMEFISSENICYYKIINADGKYLLSNNPIMSDEVFKYLAFLNNNLSELTIQCYDENKELKYSAYFDTTEYKIFKLEQ